MSIVIEKKSSYTRKLPKMRDDQQKTKKN